MSAIFICGILWAAFFVLWMLWAIGTKRALRRESPANRLAYGVIVSAGFILMFSQLHGMPWLHTRVLPDTPWQEALGLAVTLAGFAVAIWARIHLGRNWSGTVMQKVGHQLITSGPYRWVRHPIYSGFLLALLGTALVRGELRGFMSLVLVYLGFRIKSRLEERMMLNTFGPQYSNYASATGAIFPRVRKKQLAVGN